MTEIEQIIVPDFKEFLYVFDKKEVEVSSIKKVKEIPFTKNSISDFKLKSIEEEGDPIQKNRDLKTWRASFSYYCLHPEKFKFGFKDLK